MNEMSTFLEPIVNEFVPGMVWVNLLKEKPTVHKEGPDAPANDAARCPCAAQQNQVQHVMPHLFSS